MAALKHLRCRTGACANATLANGSPNPLYLMNDGDGDNGTFGEGMEDMELCGKCALLDRRYNSHITL